MTYLHERTSASSLFLILAIEKGTMVNGTPKEVSLLLLIDSQI